MAACSIAHSCACPLEQTTLATPRASKAGEDDDWDALSDRVQATVLAAEQPHLVVFSGDMVSGWACGRSPRATPCAAGWYEARWRQLVAPVRAAGIPYAIILGNHE